MTRLHLPLRGLAALFMLLAATAAQADGSPDPDRWPGQARQLKAARAGHPPAGTLVLKTPDGRPAYLLNAPCCDHFNPLFDDRGHKVCAPTGGFSGRGDGKCPAWVADAVARARDAQAPDSAASAAQ